MTRASSFCFLAAFSCLHRSQATRFQYPRHWDTKCLDDSIYAETPPQTNALGNGFKGSDSGPSKKTSDEI